MVRNICLPIYHTTDCHACQAPNRSALLNICSVYHNRKMKKLLLVFSLFFAIPTGGPGTTATGQRTIELSVFK